MIGSGMGNFIPSKTKFSVKLGVDNCVYIERRGGDYVRYDVNLKKIVNIGKMVLMEIPSFAVDVPVGSLVVGDVVIDKSKCVSIMLVTPSKIIGINLNTGRKISILREFSPIGFESITKLQTLNMNSMIGNMSM